MKNKAFTKAILKTASLCLCLVIALLCLASCSGGEDGGEKAGYTVTCEGFTFTTDMLMYDVLEGLGSMFEYGESSACPPFEGTEKLYDFVHVQVSTYQKDGADYVMSIFFKDDAVEVSGITIGSTVDEMKTAFGEKYSETNAGTYVYTAENGSTLKCIVRDGSVVSIRITTAKAN